MTNRELPTSTSNNVIEVTNSDVDVTANDVEIPTLRSGNVDESTTGSTSD
jgi:hypothetical protein